MSEYSQQRTPPPVVGIGASAGGIEALQAFFEAVPHDLGLAYVVIVHLAPDRKSDLASILKRHTDMAVTEVGHHDKVSLAPDHVYVIAPDRKLEITDAYVGSSRFDEPRGQRAAIDLFFRSLAATHGDGFAVVLSGSGSDGAMGARAVKEAGGLVLVQDPGEAGHDGMPLSVISTGAADLVLPVRELAAHLARLARTKHQLLHLAPSEPGSDENEAGLSGILELLKLRTGHDFSKYKRNTIVRRISRRMQLGHCTDFAGYRVYLKENPEEVQLLFNDLLISVTSFFRDPDAWEALQQEVIGPLIERVPPAEQIRAWVPGCATGEEVYSLAILFMEAMQTRQIARDFIIFGSDVNEAALAIAREGRYPAAISVDVTEARLQHYFRREDDHYRISGRVRDRVVFTPHNLLRDPPFSRLHLLTCRNLLIYLDRELQEQVMGVFRYACRKDAFLFLGISETADDELFRTVDKRHQIYQALPRAAGRRAELPDLLAAPRASAPRQRGPGSPSRRAAADIHATALEELAPPSVVVDDHWNIVHLSRSAGRFLQQRGGQPTEALTELVRPELQAVLHEALRNALEGHAPKLSAFVAMKFDGTQRRVAVLAQWRAAADGHGASALVTFLDAGKVVEGESPPDHENGSDEMHLMRERMQQAEYHADQMHDEQHLASEDLRSANEELQSLNEEYRATTEELETSKEELQSINEELQTVNGELKAKLEEVSLAHSDMQNLVAATNIPILFLDRDLTINRFTPQFSEIFNVQTHDLGRPIADFTHHLDYETLSEDARRVLADQAPIEQEATSSDGRFFVVRLRPYRTTADRIEGVVVTFVDVTELKRANQLQEADHHKDDFLAMLGHELRNPLAAIRNTLEAMGPKGEIGAGLAEWAWGVIYRQSRHMHRLIDDLLDVERIKRGKLKLSRARIEINQCVLDAVEALRGQIEPAGLALELELPQQPMVMDGDAERIVQMVENLIRNSINHTETGGRITVSARQEAGQAVITVRDTGAGIDPEEAAKLFEPYYQGNKSKGAKGLGLGLALVKRLAEMHGGTIEVYSQGPGTGSAFTLKLPLGTARPARPVLAIGPTASRRILVVDDQRDIADSFGALLQALGHEVAVAYCGESALEAARRLEPEVAFLDLSMPGMDGHELARRLRQEYSPERLSLVAVSGLEDRHAADHAGIFDQWLLKPVAVKTITEVLESATETATVSVAP